MLVPNNARNRPKRTFFKVEFDQTSTHLHHSEELGILLPKDFNMEQYLAADRKGRIEYAKQHVSRETIIKYQNSIIKAMLQGDPTPVPGFAGKFKQNTELTIQ